MELTERAVAAQEKAAEIAKVRNYYLSGIVMPSLYRRRSLG